MGYKSFQNYLFDLANATTKEEKRKIMHDYIYNKGGKVDYIYYEKWNVVGPLKTDHVYFVGELYNPFKYLTKNEKKAIREIFVCLLNNQKVPLTPIIKKVLINYFNIRKTSDIPLIKYYYSWCYDYFKEDIKDVKKEVFQNSEDNDLSLVLPIDRVEELSSLKELLLNSIEIENVKLYYDDIRKYNINDKLFISLLPKECSDVALCYFEEKTFIKTAKRLNLSTTKTRLLFYQATKTILSFFYSPMGIRALWLIFQNTHGILKEDDIDKMFPKYSVLLKWIFQKELVYSIRYDDIQKEYINHRSIQMIKLVGFDLDDTLLNSKKEIQDLKAVKTLVKQGIKICFCSGRPYVQTVKDYYKKIGLVKDTYYVAFNGVAVYKIDNDELIYGNFLNETEVVKIADVVNKQIIEHFKEDDFAMYSYKMDNTVVSTRINDYVMLESKFNNAEIAISDFWLEPKASHKIMISGEPKLINKLFEFIKDDLKDDFEVLISMPFFIEVYKKNNDKYQSLLKVASEYGIKEDEIMTFGDSLNDYTLVKNGKIGIAMANSVKEVKEVASFVTDNNDNYGVTKALIKYGLIKKSNHF